VPTVREAGGLAMSSRNMRLDEQEKLEARSIYKQLQTINDLKDSVLLAVLKQNAVQHLLEDGFTKIDYVEIAAPSSLEPLVRWEKGTEAVALVAAYINEVRLIDNMILH
jgi:pantoate--beta-alanine ligase